MRYLILAIALSACGEGYVESTSMQLPDSGVANPTPNPDPVPSFQGSNDSSPIIVHSSSRECNIAYCEPTMHLNLIEEYQHD